MALKIRLARAGAKKRPYYQIVVADARSPRDGRFIEKVGSYNPMVERDHPDRLKFVEERVRHWLSTGAQPTDRVARFLGDKGLAPKPVFANDPKKSQPKQRAQERLKEKAEKAAQAAEAAKAPAAESAPEGDA